MPPPPPTPAHISSYLLDFAWILYRHLTLTMSQTGLVLYGTKFMTTLVTCNPFVLVKNMDSVLRLLSLSPDSVIYQLCGLGPLIYPLCASVSWSIKWGKNNTISWS